MIYLLNIQSMTILTRQERERLVLELYYNQGKTYREIAKEARISPRDIGVILNRKIEEKTKEEEITKIIVVQKRTNKNSKTYLFPLKPINSFLIERHH
jgi:DNA-binding transcriptional regulator LsrR (DeoR family)